MNKTIDVQTRFVSENKMLALSSQFGIDLCNASQRSYLPQRNAGVSAFCHLKTLKYNNS